MKMVYRITEEDFMEARDLFIANERPWYQRLSRRLLPWIGAIVLLMQVYYLVLNPHRNFGLRVVLSAVGFYFVYCGFALRQYFRRPYQKDQRFKHDFSAEISDQGIHVVTPFSDTQMKWSGFVRFLESENIFLVFIAQWNFLVLPKRAFTPGEAEKFRVTLQRNIVPSPSRLHN